MRRVVASEYLSLDGVTELPEEFVLVTDFDDSMDEEFARAISSTVTVLVGRRAYDDRAGFWPTSDIGLVRNWNKVGLVMSDCTRNETWDF